MSSTKNTLTIAVQTISAPGSSEVVYGFTAADNNCRDFVFRWKTMEAFYNAFESRAALIEYVAGLENFAYEGSQDADNDHGYEIEGVDEIVIEGYDAHALEKNEDRRDYVLILVQAVVPVDQLHEYDREVAGLYTISVDGIADVGQQVGAALDHFHSVVAIKVLDYFEITPYTAAAEAREYVRGSHEGKAELLSVEKLS